MKDMAKHVATLISDFWVSKFVHYHLQESAPRVARVTICPFGRVTLLAAGVDESLPAFGFFGFFGVLGLKGHLDSW